MQVVPLVLLLALDKAGRSMPARIAMMAMTTRSSISVNPLRRDGFGMVFKLVITCLGKRLSTGFSGHCQCYGHIRGGQLCVWSHRTRWLGKWAWRKVVHPNGVEPFTF